MGRVLIKEAPDVDFYVEYSTVVEAPVFAGTRQEMDRFLRTEVRRLNFYDAVLRPEAVEAQFDKADEMGSTAPGWEGAWDDEFTIMEQRGLCPRARIGEFARRYLAGDSQAAYDLLEPFEDDVEVQSP
jgi:hypothetical protein